jgi:SAM-dependent methyltransferase
MQMGVGVNELRAIAFGKRLGFLQLDQTVTLGRQQIFLSQSDYDQLVEMSVLPRAEFPTSDFAEPLLKSLDANVVESIDASDYEGASIIADLNKPLGDRHYEKFTSFIDFGAMEHIFDAHQVLVNINKLLRPNGTAVILTPANGYLGHGFYQFSPEFFYSVFTPKNGFSQTVVILIDWHNSENWYYVKSPTALQERNQIPNKTYQLLCFTRKIATIDSISVQQSDYENILWTQEGYKYQINPSAPTNRSIKSSIKSFIFRQSPTLLQNLWTIYRTERMFEPIFARQTVMFNPECISGEHLKVMDLDGCARQ